MKILTFGIAFVFLQIGGYADALDDIIAQTQSADPIVRGNAFLDLEPYLAAKPIDARATNAAIALLALETQLANSADDDADYYSDLIASVAKLNTVAAIPALVQVIGTGNLVPRALAAFGTQSLGAVLARAHDPDWLVRKCVMICLTDMLLPANLPLVKDPRSLDEIALALYSGAVDTSPYVSETAVIGLGKLAPVMTIGDVNGDGKVDCSDIAIVKSSFGKKSGQTGFDARADVVPDGVIDVRDLAFVSQQLPSGTTCH